MSAEFCRLLKESIVDERKAPRDYSKLLAEAPDVATRSLDPHSDIVTIRHDEVRHGKVLEGLRRKLCRGVR